MRREPGDEELYNSPPGKSFCVLVENLKQPSHYFSLEVHRNTKLAITGKLKLYLKNLKRAGGLEHLHQHTYKMLIAEISHLHTVLKRPNGAKDVDLKNELMK